jgi:processive 1,2-diacylglycerol beta-glucosyltransferase
MFNRVLILSASAGAGHVKAGEALERAFLERGVAKEVRHVDALQFTSPMVRTIYSKGYIDMVNRAPTVLGILYDTADKPWKDENRRLMFDRLNTLPLVRLLKKYAPDLVVCTHFLPAEIISWLLCKKKINTRHSIVVTDFDMHAMWLCRHFDDYFVALDETRAHMKTLGIPAERVCVSGIPIDPVFAEYKDKIEMRRKYGLEPSLPAILLSAGGFGVGPIEEMLRSLDHMEHRAQVIALCGRNAKLKSRLESLETNRIIIKPVPHTNHMDEYMSASDILLGKPGGLTSSEALAKGLVFVVVNPIPGQEERNSDHLLEQGVAIRCNNLPTLAFKLDRLLDNSDKFNQMRKNSLQMGNPTAANDIVDHILNSDRASALNDYDGRHSCEPLIKIPMSGRSIRWPRKKAIHGA